MIEIGESASCWKLEVVQELQMGGEHCYYHCHWLVVGTLLLRMWCCVL